MSKEMTAVEWLLEQIRNNKLTFYNERDKTVPITLVGNDIVEQAKELEKWQIIDAWCDGAMPDKDNKLFAEQYYNEIYGSDGK